MTSPAPANPIRRSPEDFLAVANRVEEGLTKRGRLKGDTIAVYVENRPPAPEEQEIIRNDFALPDRLKIPVVTLNGDIATELIHYARENNITQMVLGHSDRSPWQEFLNGSIINRLTRVLRSVDILIIANAD